MSLNAFFCVEINLISFGEQKFLCELNKTFFCNPITCQCFVHSFSYVSFPKKHFF